MNPDKKMAACHWQRASELDLSVVTALDQAIFPQPWSLQQHQDGLQFPYETWLLYRVEQPVALLSLLFAGDVCDILLVGVLPERQGQGFGKQCLAQAAVLARKQGCVQLALEVRASNHTAQAFYQHAGFQMVRCRKNYYKTADGHYEDAQLLGLNLFPALS